MQDTSHNYKSQVVSSLVNESKEQTGFSIQVYSNGCKFTNEIDRPRQTGMRGGLRNPVRKFSKSSRKRLFQTMARVRWEVTGEVVFVTLTYHFYRQWQPRECMTHLHCFLQFLRDNFSSPHFIWRLEFQKRGAPHFHLILANSKSGKKLSTPFARNQLACAWNRIANPNSRAAQVHGVNIQTVTSYKMVCAYLAKYVAKEQDGIAEYFTARRWAQSESWPTDPYVDFDLKYSVWRFLRETAIKFLKAKADLSDRFLTHILGDGSVWAYINADEFRKILLYCMEKVPDDDPDHLTLERIFAAIPPGGF